MCTLVHAYQLAHMNMTLILITVEYKSRLNIASTWYQYLVAKSHVNSKTHGTC